MSVLSPSAKRERWIAPALFVLLASGPLFMHLDSLPIRIWDESRQAISVLEMLRSGNWLVAYYDGEPDMWNTKPPLLIWLQALCFSIIGHGELALRLPSAIAAFLTGWFLLRTTNRQLGMPWLGLIACLILYTSAGYIHFHVARGGDFDALLVLFMCTSAWALFRWTQNGKPADLLWFFGLLTLGAMTKSIQAFLFVPGLGVYLLLTRKVGAFFRNRYTYFGLATLLGVLGAFYLVRESVNPGYLQAVWDNELGGRYASSLEGHEAAWDFYLDLLVDHHFVPWWPLVPCGIALGLAHADKTMRQWTALLTCMGVGYFFVITSAGTKLEWYSAPLFPVIAALAAISIHLLFQWLRTAGAATFSLHTPVLPWVLLFFLFVQPYSDVIGRVYFPKENPWDEEFYTASYYLHKAVRGGPMEADVICYSNYNAHLRFYTELMQHAGRDVPFATVDELRPGMRPMASEHETKAAIESVFRYRVLHEEGMLRIYELIERNEPTP